MHVMGKVGVGLVAVAAIASTVLTAKLIQVRNSWTKKSDTLQKSYQALQPKIVELTEQQARLEAELFRERDLWGRAWNNVPTQVQRQADGVLAVNLGTNDGLREKQYLYGFEILPNGSTVYRGDFTVITSRDVQSQLQPNWKVRPEDVQNWQPESKWRWRNMIPKGYQPAYDEQLLTIVRADDTLVDRKIKQATEKKLDVQAQGQLKRREAELIGGEQLSKEPTVNIEFREGLVAAVEQAEEARNQVLVKVDDLRRRLRATKHQIDQRTMDNLELTRKLPQPATAIGSAKN